MMWCKSWPFLLHHNLQPNVLQAISICLCRARLVDNIPESFGDLDCIFSSAWVNKANSMTNVGLWKLWWVSSWGLLKTETRFGAKSGDGSIGNTSLRWDLVIREARIKERKDMILQCRCQCFHSDMELFNKLLWFVCYCSIVTWYREASYFTTYSKLVIVWKSASVDF